VWRLRGIAMPDQVDGQDAVALAQASHVAGKGLGVAAAPVHQDERFSRPGLDDTRPVLPADVVDLTPQQLDPDAHHAQPPWVRMPRSYCCPGAWRGGRS